MADKNVSIKVPGADGKGEEMVPVAIAPGSTAADVIRKLGKNPAEWILSIPNGKTFAQNDNVYGAVEDGGKLVLTPKMEAGGITPGFLQSLFGKLAVPDSAGRPRIRVTHELPKPVVRVTHQEALAVKPQATPTWQEQGWHRHPLGSYTGRYVTPHGSWEGRIETGPTGVSRVLINNPPYVIQWHPKYPCFVHKGGDWFELHWETRTPRTVDAAMVNMERILSEAFQTAQWLGRPTYGTL